MELKAQEAPAFSRVELGAGAMANVFRPGLDEFWGPAHGPMVRIATPFYAGRIAASVHTAVFEAFSTEQPDFKSRLVAVEWELVAGGLETVSGSAGVHVGAMLMHFDDSLTPIGNQKETELFIGGGVGLAWRLDGPFSIEAGAAHRKVLTHRPLHLTHLSLGLRYTAAMPGWARSILE